MHKLNRLVKQLKQFKYNLYLMFPKKKKKKKRSTTSAYNNTSMIGHPVTPWGFFNERKSEQKRRGGKNPTSQISKTAEKSGFSQ